MTKLDAVGYWARDWMRGLYAIVDTESLDARGLDPIAFTEAVLKASPAAVQLRAKNFSSRESLALLRQLAPACRRAGVPLVANDRPDLATFAGCDFTHVGQSDMPIERIRRLTPGLRVGVSTHTMDELDAALAERPAYVAFGPVFQTSTKEQADPVVGVAALREAHERTLRAGIPLVAIGGITLARARELVGWVEAVAVISGLLPSLESAAAARTTGGAARAGDDLLREVTARALAFQALFATVPPRRSRGASA